MLRTLALVVVGSAGLGALGCGLAFSSWTLACVGAAGLIASAIGLLAVGLHCCIDWVVSKTT
jgi:hypothetical protein